MADADYTLGDVIECARRAVDECSSGDQTYQPNDEALRGLAANYIIFASMECFRPLSELSELSREEKSDLGHTVVKLREWCEHVQDSATETKPWLTELMQHTRQLEMLHVFADYDLSSVLTTYTRIKVLLAEEAANSPWSGLAEISPFSCLTDYYIVGGNHSDFPEVMRLEAKLAEGITVAKHALKILWDVAAQLDSFGLTRRRTMKRPGEDAVIVRHLIKAITDMEDGYNLGSMHCTIQGPSTTAKASSRPIASGGECHSIHSIHQEMAGLLSRAGENLKVQGSERFFRTSMEFYTAALAYAEADAKAPIACQLAQARLAVQKLNKRSLKSPLAAIAAENKARKALDRLRPLKDSWKIISGALTMLLTEAERATAPAPVLASIKESLRMLWEDTVAVPIPSTTGDAILVYLLIKLMKETEQGYELQVAFSAAGGNRMSDDEGGGDDDDSDDGSSQKRIHHRLAEVFDQARERLAVVGKENFFGVLPPSILAKSAGPAAATANTAGVPLAAALMFRACGSFYDAAATRTPQEEVARVNAYVNATRNAQLAWGKDPSCESTLSILHDMHRKASAGLKAAKQLPTVNPEDLEMYARIMCTLGKNMALRFQGYGHLMLEFIERAKTGTGSAGRYDAKTMTQVGFACLVMPPDPLTDAAKAAWRAGLELMRSQRVPPDVNLCAKTVKDLYELSSEEEALTLLAEVSDFVRSVEVPSYPSQHLKELISTAWEHGCEQAKAQRHSKARAYMTAALNLMDFCESYKISKKKYIKLFAKSLEEATE